MKVLFISGGLSNNPIFLHMQSDITGKGLWNTQSDLYNTKLWFNSLQEVYTFPTASYKWHMHTESVYKHLPKGKVYFTLAGKPKSFIYIYCIPNVSGYYLVKWQLLHSASLSFIIFWV